MDIDTNLESKKNMIAAYVNGTLRAKDVAMVEELIGSEGLYRRYFERKKQEHEFILQMIPQAKLKLNEKKMIVNDIREITHELWGMDKVPWREKLKDFLDKPIIRVEF